MVKSKSIGKTKDWRVEKAFMKNDNNILIKISDYCFAYSGENNDALHNINLSIERGEFVTIAGPSGSGKSTLIRQISRTLSKSGTESGSIELAGIKISQYKERDIATKIGFISQDIDNQLVCNKVWHELAFAMENLGFEQSMIRRRVAEIASFFGIENIYHSDISELSGGQRQLVCLASVMVLEPEILILDEPVSQLDPINAESFIEALKKINTELGTTVVIVEHNLLLTLAGSSKLVLMDKGSIACAGKTSDVITRIQADNINLMDYIPSPMRLWALDKNTESECPLTIASARRWFQNHEIKHYIDEQVKKPEQQIEKQKDIIISIKDMNYAYAIDLQVLKNLSLDVYKGETLAIAGGNGTGKSTLLKVISGIIKADRGKIVIKRAMGLGYLSQNPIHSFLSHTVIDDYRMACDDNERIEKVINDCGIGNLINKNPYDLSGGQLQMAAIAKVLLNKPSILLLDEPTKGLDQYYRSKIVDILKVCKLEKITTIIVSHDMDFCEKVADRCALLFDGAILSVDNTRAFINDNAIYTTIEHKISKGIADNIINYEDAYTALYGEGQARKESEASVQSNVQIQSDIEVHQSEMVKHSEKIKHSEKSGKLSKILAAIMIILALPLTLYIGTYMLDDKKYIFISLLVLVEAIVPLYIFIERQAKGTRYIVMIAVMSALCIAGRSVFYMLPQFKPVVALVILTGVTLGGEAGFAVGAISMLVSNVIFGQGPWTSWQMFAMGTLGYVSGILFFERIKSGTKSIILLSVYGFLATLIIYGGIMNVSAAALAKGMTDAKTFFAYYVAGIPMDIVHGISTFIFVLIGGRMIIEKINRVRDKYY